VLQPNSLAKMHLFSNQDPNPEPGDEKHADPETGFKHSFKSRVELVWKEIHQPMYCGGLRMY